MGRAALPEDLVKLKTHREEELREYYVRVLSSYVLHLVLDDSILGELDLAFGIDKQALVKEALHKVIEKLDSSKIDKFSENTH